MNLKQSRDLLAFLILFTVATAQGKLSPYSEGALTKLEAANQPVVLHFHADWCPTCRKQKKVLSEIATDPKFSAVEILEVNYDAEKALKEKLSVRSQSILVYLKGTAEKGRSQGVVDKAQISTEIEKHLVSLKKD